MPIGEEFYSTSEQNSVITKAMSGKRTVRDEEFA
jgi:hypothetical protein